MWMPWTVELTGNFANTNVPLIVGDGSSLIGAASLTSLTTQDGAAVVNEIHEFTVAKTATVSILQCPFCCMKVR